ncbi:MAG: pyridoxamine 5'-phosphate oxidase family protein [Mucilaginibacter sp.]
MEKRIADFINENKTATICCTDGNNMPYCFHCFYAFDEVNGLLFFKSSADTYHIKLISVNGNIAGSILPEKQEFFALKGVQLTGSVLYGDIPGHHKPETFYHKRFPFALAMPGDVWCIQLEMVKMTDNSRVFGKKLIWKKDELITTSVE